MSPPNVPFIYSFSFHVSCFQAVQEARLIFDARAQREKEALSEVERELHNDGKESKVKEPSIRELMKLIAPDEGGIVLFFLS
jgi:hypothetical protein